MSDDIGDDFQPIISLENPVEDYKLLIKLKRQGNEYVEDEVLEENYAKISAKMREVIWTLLFANKPASDDDICKAADCLKEHRKDAAYYCPWDYNDWIPMVRDELLKREMFHFWREEMVKHELGPCWARDSDYFDDLETEEPAEFYRYAGCVAPFSKEAQAALGCAQEQLDKLCL